MDSNRTASMMSLLPARSKSRRVPITLDTQAVMEETLSAAEYLTLSRTRPDIIKSVQIVAPKPGQRSFGVFAVKYLVPQHKVAG